MKKIIATLTLTFLFVFNCSSIQVSEPEIDTTPQLKIGCSAFEGKAWERCMVKLVDKLSKISNTPPTKKLIESRRISEDYILHTYSFCFGDEDICAIDYDKERNQSFSSKVKNFTIVGLGGFLIGLLTGVVYVP